MTFEEGLMIGYCLAPTSNKTPGTDSHDTLRYGNYEFWIVFVDLGNNSVMPTFYEKYTPNIGASEEYHFTVFENSGWGVKKDVVVGFELSEPDDNGDILTVIIYRYSVAENAYVGTHFGLLKPIYGASSGGGTI